MKASRQLYAQAYFIAALLAASVLLSPWASEGTTGRGQTSGAAQKRTAPSSGSRHSKDRPSLVAKKSSSSKKKTSKKTSKKTAKKPAPPPVPRAPDPNRVTFQTPDGVELTGSWVPVEGLPGAPAVLLVHAFSRDRREWEPFVAAFREKGISVLTIDLRGHGESTKKKSGRLQVTPRLLRDPQAFPRDVQAACLWLRERAQKVGVAGWQVGANLSVLATANGWAEAGVAISPSSSNLAELAGGRATQPRATLVIASVGDPGREPSARALVADGQGPKKLIVYPGAEHARTLLEKHEDALAETVRWMVDQLGAVPPSLPVPIMKVPSVSASVLPPPAETPQAAPPPVP